MQLITYKTPQTNNHSTSILTAPSVFLFWAKRAAQSHLKQRMLLLRVCCCVTIAVQCDLRNAFVSIPIQTHSWQEQLAEKQRVRTCPDLPISLAFAPPLLPFPQLPNWALGTSWIFSSIVGCKTHQDMWLQGKILHLIYKQATSFVMIPIMWKPKYTLMHFW